MAGISVQVIDHVSDDWHHCAVHIHRRSSSLVTRGQLQAYLVSPPAVTQMPIAARPRQDDLRDPLSLKNLVAGDLASQHLYLFDSRTRYWRYYLLIGPSPRWQSVSMGNKLLRIVRDNCRHGNKAQRGVGKNLFNACKYELKRRATAREIKALVRVFRNQYGSAAKRFWEHAKQNSGYDVLLNAASQVRYSQNYDGFFAVRMPSVNDGHARRAFHRLLMKQSPEATELGRLIFRSRSIMDALARIKTGTLKEPESRRMVLSWLLLSLLYQQDTTTPEKVSRYRVDEEDEDEAKDFGGCEQQLVRVALKYLRHDSVGLDEMHRAHIVRHLTHAVQHAPYRAPIRVSPLNSDGSRRRLFADLRLSAFRNLLRSTGA